MPARNNCLGEALEAVEAVEGDTPARSNYLGEAVEAVEAVPQIPPGIAVQGMAEAVKNNSGYRNSEGIQTSLLVLLTSTTD